MNKIILIGNLSKEPELTETSNGISVCRFSVAVNRPYSDSDGERKADFFNVTVWRGLAENVAKYCRKGSKVAVEGSVQIEQHEGNDGVKRTYVTVVAQNIEFLTPKQTDSTPAQAPREKSGQMDMFGGTSTGNKKASLQRFDDIDDFPF